MKPTLSVIMVVLATAALVGCGSGGSTGAKEGSTSKGGSTTAANHPKPIGPPPDKESLAEAEDRIDKTIASNDCDRINSLNLVSLSSQLDTSQRCQYLKRLSAAERTGGESFKDLAAVLDYATANRKFSVVLLRDVDGKYHIAFIDPFHTSPTVGTEFASQFDASAKQAFNALRDKDCKAYLKVVYTLSGVGTLGKKACPHVEKNLIAGVLENDPSAKLQTIGGNGFYAFYGLDTPPAFVTLVMARETQSEIPPGLPKGVGQIPKGAAEYAYVGAYRTNEHNPPSQ